MGKALIIVESPAKIKTLKKFLGPHYIVESSVGHIRDLPEKEFGIDIEHGFEPKYVILPNKEEVISRLQKAAKQCDVVYLSPDPDREGEAIAWHIMQILPPQTKVKRVSFNSLTKDVVLKALENPRPIDLALFYSQQLRRLLDRIVGYKISPLLNRRIQRGISAGRVQSIALKFVIDREKQILVFIPIEYWNLGAILKTGAEERQFRAYLYSVDRKRVEKEGIEGKEVTLIPNKEAADAILARMRPGRFKVLKVERKEKRRHPVPPFITSTLQQEASRHYGFSASRTMGIAQSLYEGVDLGSEGAEGLITYMRTDSVRVVPEAIAEARLYIQHLYGPEYIPSDSKQYATQKSAQDAHEAIRPANLNYPPEQVKPYLTPEQFFLYQLIWRRFLASQMVAAVYDTVSADITGGEGILLRANGSMIKFLGFLAVYEEKEDEEEKDEKQKEENRMLPLLEEGQFLFLQQLIAEQAFTRHPPRYTEASLVKELEKSGIGRPSTYATIMNKIQSREYTMKENGRLKPTELGQVIAQMLESNFQQIMNADFTAKMEDNLESVAENNKDWRALIQEFWDQFNPTVEAALKEAFVPKIMTDINCPKCEEGRLQKIWSRSKYFYGCSRYPKCTYSVPIEEVTFKKEDYAADFDWEQPCPTCKSEMKVRHGRYGAFLGCTRYPDCKGIINIPNKGEMAIPQEDLPSCPAITCPGHIIARKSRFGKTFYSCSTFPDCNVIVNQLDQLTTKYPNHLRAPFQKKERKGRGKAMAVKPTKEAVKAKKGKGDRAAKKSQIVKPTGERKMPVYLLSEELAAVVGSTALERGEVTKKIWEYIKKHDLQDRENKRLIRPDSLLSGLFGSNEPIDMFKMARLLNPHINRP